MNEHEQFLNSLGEDNPKEVDILEAPLTPEPEKEGEETPITEETTVEPPQELDEDDTIFGIKPKNRRERRRLQRLVEDRESAIDLANRLNGATEAAKVVTEESDYLKAIESLYGTETPEGKLATELLKKAIVGARDDAETRAYTRIQQERQEELAQEVEAEQELDNIIDEIEDTYDVSLNPTQERSYFQLLQKMSPKDRNGNVIAYADPHAVWESFQEKISSNKQTTNKAKDLASRSMVNSGASKDSTLPDDVAARYLKEAGIL